MSSNKAQQPRPLIELTKVRFREFIREPEAVFWVFVFPVIMACTLGIAFRNTGPDKIRVAVDTDAPAAVARTEALRKSQMLEVETLSSSEATLALRTGRVSLVVTGPEPGAVYWYDPSRPETRSAKLEVDDAMQRSAGRTDSVVASDVAFNEPGGRYIDWLVPGLIGLNLMGTGFWGVGFSVVTARKNRLLKRLAATPMRRSDYLLSHVFSRLIFLVLEVVSILGFAWLFFAVPIHGSLLALAVAVLVGAGAFSGLGLLVAARPRTIEGVSGLMNFVMVPMWLLSGTFFSSERFPAVVQPFIKVLPLTALNDALRMIINDGRPLTAVWAEVGLLAAWAVVSFVVALKLFRWQ